MKKIIFVFVAVFVLLNILPVMATEPVGEGGSYVPKQEAETTEKPSIQSTIESALSQQKLISSWGQQVVDAAKAVNGTWQVQGYVYFSMGTMPYNAVERWTYDARSGKYYDSAGWQWDAKAAGNYLQATTKLQTGSQAMITMQFLSNNEAVVRINVSQCGNMPACMSELKAVRMQ